MYFGYVDFTDEGQPYYVGIGNDLRVRRMGSRNAKHEGVRRKYGQRREVLFASSDWITMMLENALTNDNSKRHLDRILENWNASDTVDLRGKYCKYTSEFGETDVEEVLWFYHGKVCMGD